MFLACKILIMISENQYGETYPCKREQKRNPEELKWTLPVYRYEYIKELTKYEVEFVLHKIQYKFTKLIVYKSLKSHLHLTRMLHCRFRMQLLIRQVRQNDLTQYCWQIKMPPPDGYNKPSLEMPALSQVLKIIKFTFLKNWRKTQTNYRNPVHISWSQEVTANAVLLIRSSRLSWINMNII